MTQTPQAINIETQKKFIKYYEEYKDRKLRRQIQGVMLLSMFMLALASSQLIASYAFAPLLSVGLFIASFVFLFAYFKISLEDWHKSEKN